MFSRLFYKSFKGNRVFSLQVLSCEKSLEAWPLLSLPTEAEEAAR